MSTCTGQCSTRYGAILSEEAVGRLMGPVSARVMDGCTIIIALNSRSSCGPPQPETAADTRFDVPQKAFSQPSFRRKGGMIGPREGLVGEWKGQVAVEEVARQ